MPKRGRTTGRNFTKRKKKRVESKPTILGPTAVHGIKDQAGSASLKRIERHTVGIVNSVRTVGTNPLTGGRGDSEEPGTGCAGKWGSHYFILTAKHVIENATPADLRIFSFPTENLKRGSPSEVKQEDVVDATPVDGQTSTLYRYEWEDLAILTTPPNVFPYLEFVDTTTDWIDPPAGEMLHCIGFPFDRGFVCDKKIEGNKQEWTVALYPTLLSATVLPLPTEDELKFKITAFDPACHYLVPFVATAPGRHPHGFSGTGMWWESDQKREIWRPDFRFAGICIYYYRSSSVLQIVKASVVRRFLEEVFGPVT